MARAHRRACWRRVRTGARNCLRDQRRPARDPCANMSSSSPLARPTRKSKHLDLDMPGILAGRSQKNQDLRAAFEPRSKVERISSNPRHLTLQFGRVHVETVGLVRSQRSSQALQSVEQSTSRPPGVHCANAKHMLGLPQSAHDCPILHIRAFSKGKRQRSKRLSGARRFATMGAAGQPRQGFERRYAAMSAASWAVTSRSGMAVSGCTLSGLRMKRARLAALLGR